MLPDFKVWFSIEERRRAQGLGEGFEFGIVVIRWWWECWCWSGGWKGRRVVVGGRKGYVDFGVRVFVIRLILEPRDQIFVL